MYKTKKNINPNQLFTAELLNLSSKPLERDKKQYHLHTDESCISDVTKNKR